MAEQRSALAGIRPASPHGARVTLSELRPGSILQVVAWPNTVGTVQGVMAVFLGVQVPKSGSGVSEGEIMVATIAPGRHLITSNATDLIARFEAALPTSDAAVTDVTHGMVIMRLEGDAAPEVLSRCIALDLDISAFPKGHVARTAVHHHDVVVYRQSPTSFDLWASRSFAESLAEWVLDAGVEFPIAFQGSAPRSTSQTDTPLP